jgi:hypothetical protein
VRRDNATIPALPALNILLSPTGRQ